MVAETLDIKIITGVRRSRKSKLLEMFKEYIKSNINNYNSIDKKYDYLNDIYNTLIVRDIFARDKIH